MTLERGALLYGRYQILEILGQGGMGSIYRAVDENLGVEVAVKENLFTTEEYARQFRREAVILASLRHQNLPRVSDHFVIDGQGQYLVMDYIEGDDLREQMDRLGEIPEREMLDISIVICDAMTYMHTRKPPVLHRDIKPGNVKITSEGEIYLVDFGLAKVLHHGEVTSTGARAMTPGYSPPEQYGGARTDNRSDIYSLGATMYAALTGSIPEDSLARTMEQTVLTPVRKRNASISRKTANAIEKALEVHPDDRYQTAEEFKIALLTARKASKPIRTGEGVIKSSFGTPSEEKQTAEPKPVPGPRRLPIYQDENSLPLPASAALDDHETGASKPKKKRRGRGCLLAIGILMILLMAGIGGAYLIDPTYTTQVYNNTSDQVFSLAFEAGIIPRWIVNPRPATTTVESPDLQVTRTNTQSPPTITPTLTNPQVFTSTPTGTSPPTLTPSKQPEPTITPTSTTVPTATPLGGGHGQIAFVSNRTGQPQIWVINVDGTGLKQITQAPAGACQPDWSPDGSQIVYTSPCRTNLQTYLSSGLFIIDSDGSNMQALPIQGKGNYDPAWSPDGKTIAFTSLRENERPQIWIADLTTGEAEILSDGPNRDFQPAWSPDGSQIIFITTRNGPYQIWTMNPDGSDQTRFSVSGDLRNTSPVLSPDGKLLVFTQGRGEGSISRLKGVFYPEGATQEFYLYTLSGGFPMREADFSPDAFWIAFESYPDGEMHDIYIMSPNGAELTQLTFDPAWDFDAAWRP